MRKIWYIVTLGTSIFMVTPCSYSDESECGDGLVVFPSQHDDNDENYQNQSSDILEPGMCQLVVK